MANVKNITIQGRLPFDCATNDDMCKILGQLNSPTLGIRIHWSGDALEHVPNGHGGKTAMYGFMIRGMEAVSYPFLDHLIKTIKTAGGTVTVAKASDMENGGLEINLLAGK